MTGKFIKLWPRKQRICGKMEAGREMWRKSPQRFSSDDFNFVIKRETKLHFGGGGSINDLEKEVTM